MRFLARLLLVEQFSRIHFDMSNRSPNISSRKDGGHLRAMLRGRGIKQADIVEERERSPPQRTSSNNNSKKPASLALRASERNSASELASLRARIAELEEEKASTDRFKLFMEQLSAILSSDVNRIVDAAYSFIPAEYINLFVVKDDHLKCIVSRNKQMYDKNIRRGDGIFGYVAKSGRAVNLVDPVSDWRYDADSDVHAGMGEIKSLLVVPIRGPTGSVTCVMEAVNCLRQPGTKNTPVPASPYRSTPRTAASSDAKSSQGKSSAYSFEVAQTSDNTDGFLVEDEAIIHVLAQGISLMTERDALLQANQVQKKQTDALHQIVGLNQMGITTNWKDEPRAKAASQDEKEDAAGNSQTEAVKKIIRACYMICDVEFVRLYLVDHANHELICTGKNTPQGHRISFRDSGIEGFVATSGQVVNCPDVSKDLRFDVDLDGGENDKYKYKTMLVVPVKDAFGTSIAVIKLCNRKVSDSAQISRRFALSSGSKNDLTIPFSDVDEQMICSLATTAAGILEQARLYEDAVNTRTATETLLRINELIQRATGVEMIVPKIIESAYRLIDAERITLFTMQEQAAKKRGGAMYAEGEEESKVLLCRVSADPGFVGVKLPWGKGIVGQAARTQKTIVIRDGKKCRCV
jgi:GAF domain-containing protein